MERVVWPVEGQGVWAYRARVIDTTEPVDVRAYVRADEELGLLYAQDVSCSASFGEGRVFRTNPARDPAPEVVRLAGLEGRRGVLKTGNLKLIPAVGNAFTNAKRDFRLEPAEGGFEEVCAFHHMANAMQFFRDLLGAEVFNDEPFGPLTIRVQDRTVGGSSRCILSRPTDDQTCRHSPSCGAVRRHLHARVHPCRRPSNCAS